jgi:hypothetical protein
MSLSKFTANYARFGDDELLSVWTDRETLVPEAAMALDSELQRRGLKKESAARIKKRLDMLATREEKGPLAGQVAAAKYERNMRHFVGCEEPEFHSRYGRRDMRASFAYIWHKYRVWKAFREHTGHWPAFSICFHFLSWIAIFGLVLAAFVWVEERKRQSGWSVVAVIGCVLVLLGARDLGAQLMRKLDWKRFGT